MATRVRYTAEYDYPGSLFPESATRDIRQPTFETILAAAPAEEGYFRADGWYAVTLRAITEKHFVADDGQETWVRVSTKKIHSWVIGEKVHADDLPDDDQHRILKANILGNTSDGYGVRTRIGNWQMASDYDTVLLSTSAVTA